jgi:hypothetical protein
MTRFLLITLTLLLTSSTLSAQSFNFNFEDGKQGWTSHQSVERTKLFSQLEDRHGLSFSEQNPDKDIILLIQKEIKNLKPNTNYRITFNMNWLAWLDAYALPIFVKVGAINQEPTAKIIDLDNENEDIIAYKFDKGEIGRNGRDFIVAGQLNPNENGLPFLKNVHNLNNPFFVNTDEKGRLFLMIGIESGNVIIENVFLSTVRVLLRENGEARETQEVEKPIIAEVFVEKTEDIIEIISSTIVFVPNAENDLVFFKSDYNDDIEMVNIYTEDNHLMKFFSFRDPSDSRAFETIGLAPGVYRIEFLLSDGRVINELYTVK